MLWLVSAAALVFLTTTLILCRVVVDREADFDEAITEILENSENRVQIILAQSAQPLSRPRIHEWMGAMYRETVLMAVGLGGFTAHISLVLFNVLIACLWLKTWVWPDPRDLRILLGGEMFILCQLKQGNE